MIFKIFFLNCILVLTIYSLSIDAIINNKFSVTSEEKNTEIADLKVDFEYNEDYSQFKFNNKENIDYIDITTQKNNHVVNNTIYSPVALNINEYDLNSLKNVNSSKTEENVSNIEQMKQLSIIFNIGHISTATKIPNDFMPPQFMTDLYYTITEQNNNLLQTIGASAIISLPEMNSSAPELFKFDLSGISDQDILEAELHVYRIGREVSIPLHHSPYYLLKLYQILPNDNLMSWNPDVHQLLNVHYVPSFITGWQIFKVKRALNSWLNESAPNLGFLITASTVVNEPIDINFARKNRFSNKYQPSLVLFTKDKKSRQNIDDYNFYTDSTMESNNSQYSECTKKSMYINFTANYFNNFVIEPKGYESCKCAGTCKYPEKLQSPNYSVLKRVLLNTVETISSNLCCVPEKLKSLVVLYLSEDKVVLQQIENMIIESCSCR